MKVENYFKPSNVTETLQGNVWAALSIAYDDLTATILENVDECGKQWHKIKVRKFVFLNIVRYLSNNCNIHTLSITYNQELKVNNESDHSGYYECPENRPSFSYQPKNFYERDFLWGGLYFVLAKQQSDETLLERVRKTVNYATGNNTRHYFEKWEAALTGALTIEMFGVKAPSELEIKKSKTVFMYLTQFSNYYTQFNNLIKYPFIPTEIREKFIRPRITLISACKAQLGWQTADLGISPLPDKFPQDYFGKDYDENDEKIGLFIKKYFPELYNEDLFPTLKKIEKEQTLEPVTNKESENPSTYFKYFTDLATMDDWKGLLDICTKESKKGTIATAVRYIIDLYKKGKVSKIYDKRQEVLDELVKYGLPNDISAFNTAVRNNDTDKDNKLFA